MTVPSTPRQAGPFTGTGALVSYPFSFKVFTAADLRVTVTDTAGSASDLVLDSTMLVALNADQETTPGGSVQYAVAGVATALPSGYVLAINGEGLVFQQSADLPQGGNFNPTNLENALDSLQMQLLILKEQVDRSLKFPLSDVGSDQSLPPAAIRALKMPTFDASGNLVVTAPASGSAAELAGTLANYTTPLVGAGALGYRYTNNYALKTIGRKLNSLGKWAVADLEMDNTGAADCLAKLQAAWAAGYVVYFEPGVYALSSFPTPVDGCGIVGSGCHWDRRTGYDYDPAQQTVFKYTGSTGTNSCVIRASAVAVGSQGSDFTTPGTDDLINFTLQDFHIDCDNKAEIGLYIYRAGNGCKISNITVEKAKKRNIMILGVYAAQFGPFGAFLAEEHGVEVGWDYFSWGTVEATCFNFDAAFLLANNGTSHTFVLGSGTDEDNSGGRFSVGRGSRIAIDSESNYGRAAILSQYNIASGAGGSSTYETRYIEANGGGAAIDYRDGMDGIKVCAGYIHPGNGGSLVSQDFKVKGKNNSGVLTSDSGPTDRGEWLVFESLFGDLSGTGFAIDSNTYKYAVRGCSNRITYPASKPGIDDWVSSDRQVTAHCYFTASASPTLWNQVGGTLARTGAGTFVFTFDKAFRTAGQHTPMVSIVLSAALNTSVRLTSIGTTAVTIVTYNAGGAAADTGDRIGFMMAGLLT